LKRRALKFKLHCAKCLEKFKDAYSLGSHIGWCCHEGREFSEIHKLRLSESKRGDKNPSHIHGSKKKGKTYGQIFGRERGLEVKKKLVESHLGQKPFNRGMKWRDFLSEDSFRRLTENRRRRRGRTWEELFGIETALRMKNALSEIKGEKHPSWRGGKKAAIYGSDFNLWVKRVVAKRDGGICRVCGLKKKRWMSIHHIDYDKNNNKVENLVLLCINCHMSTNWMRESWIIFFEKQKERMGGLWEAAW